MSPPLQADRNQLILKSRDEITEFLARLTSMHAEAGRLGLLRTVHRLHDTVREAGWEFEEMIRNGQFRLLCEATGWRVNERSEEYRFPCDVCHGWHATDLSEMHPEQR